MGSTACILSHKVLHTRFTTVTDEKYERSFIPGNGSRATMLLDW